MRDICTQVAQYLTEVTFDSLPNDVVERAKTHILDTIGVMLAVRIKSNYEFGILCYGKIYSSL